MTSKVKRPARPLAQLNRVERHIKKQVQMSKVIDHLYAEHNDQLEFTHKQARKKVIVLPVVKVKMSLKIKNQL
jgi:hypothetical protein